MSFSTDYKTIKYNYGNQSDIFVPGEHYGVVSKISDHWVSGNTIYFETGLTDLMKGTISIDFFENDSFRLKYFRYGEKNRYEEHLSFPKKLKLPVKNAVTEYIINFKKYNIYIGKKDFDIKITNSKGEKVFSLYKRLGYEFFAKYLAPPLGFKTINKHEANPFITFDLQNDENIYGLGEKYKSVEKTGIKSQSLSQSTNIVCSTDISYSSIPLIYSTKGWGLFVNSGFKTQFEIGSYATDALSIMAGEPCLDLFIMLDPSIKGLQKKYTDFTGRISNLPEKGYGVIVSRLYYNNAKEAINEIKEAKKREFPIDIVGIDPKWLNRRYTKTCNFDFNEEAFGKLEDFTKQAKELGVETSLWINTNVQGDDSEFFKTSLENNYLVKNAKGELENAQIGPALVQNAAYAIDFTNQEAYDFYKDHVKRLLNSGVRFLTPDYGGGVAKDALMHNGRSGLEMKNFSQWLYPKAVFEAMEEVFGKGNALLYRRPGFIGTHKFAGKWGGDSFARFQELRNQIRAGISNGICSEFMWGIDMGGGYRGTPYQELTMRWNQAGALLPFTRFHGIGKREPWYTSKAATENAKKYLLLKRSLLPYYKHFELEASKNGTSFIRALVIEFQNDRMARTIDDQFMLGDKIMVAPVIVENERKRQVYFPLGTNWVDFDTKKTYAGGQSVLIDAPIDKLPIFVKEGESLPFIVSKVKEYDLDNVPTKFRIVKYGKTKKEGKYEFIIAGKKHKLPY